MFSNRQQQNSSNLLNQTISSSSSIVLPPPPPAIIITSNVTNSHNSSAVTSVATSILALDGLNCDGIPTRTTPTLTPTTLRNIAADIASMSPGTSEDFAASAASDLHHLVSSSCTNINVPSSIAADHLGSEGRHNLQKLSNQHLNLQNLNNQHISLSNLQNSQHLNQNSLNQQQQNDYNNSFSTVTSRQAGFVPPLVLQINANAPQPSGSTVLLNSNTNSGSSSIFSVKGSSTSASSSHWQGVVVTQTPQRQSRSVNRRRFTDDENGEDDYDSVSDDGTDSSDTTTGKNISKQEIKNIVTRTIIKNEFKNVGNSSGSGRRNKDNKIMSAEEEHRRQIRRERNKLAAARCRKRRMDHTNELLEETEQLEDKRLRLQVEIQGLRQQKTNLQQMLAQHKCAVSMNNGHVSNSVSTVSQAIATLDSISESDTTVLSNNLSTTKRNPLHQQNISTNVNSDNDSNNVGDILIKCEEPSLVITDDDNKDNIPLTVLQQPQRRRPTTLLQLNNVNFGNNKKMSENGSTGVVVLNFDSLMDGGTGLTPVSTSVGSVQNHHQHVQHNTGSDVNTANNSVLS
ncbi:transcription factor kayak isoform X2 [Sipha flava]|uniref:Transcription factor kayak n=1 Tax=Sipha flava TaxID=143950 RepID=A0A2S2QME9_9HEMI|nr:transcription factor kayak isoform X2 [Sipha flava]